MGVALKDAKEYGFDETSSEDFFAYAGLGRERGDMGHLRSA